MREEDLLYAQNWVEQMRSAWGCSASQDGISDALSAMTRHEWWASLVLTSIEVEISGWHPRTMAIRSGRIGLIR